MVRRPIKEWIHNQVAGAVLEEKSFGHSATPSVWIKASVLTNVCKALVSHEGPCFNFLENLSVAQIGDALVFNYFLRSHEHADSLVLRLSVQIEDERESLNLSSVSEIWLSAKAFEKEISPLFGVRFERATDESRNHFVFGDDDLQFPLRKKSHWKKNE